MFCKFCGKPLGKGTHCDHCGKENPLVKRSGELDALMQGQPEPSAPGKTYQQGLTEGFANGRKEGYEAGVKDGYDDGLQHGQKGTPGIGKRRLWLGAAAVAVLLAAIAVGGAVGHRSGYSGGLAAGEQLGRQAASAELETAYADASAQAQRDYEARLAEQYRLGYEQGNLDAQAAMPTPTVALDPRDDAIRKGDRGEEVKAIQQLLIGKGWELEVDGQYGPATAKAVGEFQGLNRLEETGEVNILTYWALLSEASLGASATMATASPTPTAEPAALPWVQTIDDALASLEQAVATPTMLLP